MALFVNVASRCGYTKQYKGLEALYQSHKAAGFTIVGVPCNQFGEQEPGDAKEIAQFCEINYGVTFPLFAKVDVNGEGACALYKYLTALETKPQGAGPIGWNFEKFLVNRKGEVVARFNPRTKPDAPEVIARIEAELAAK